LQFQNGSLFNEKLYIQLNINKIEEEKKLNVCYSLNKPRVCENCCIVLILHIEFDAAAVKQVVIVVDEVFYL